MIENPQQYIKDLEIECDETKKMLVVHKAISLACIIIMSALLFINYIA